MATRYKQKTKYKPKRIYDLGGINPDEEYSTAQYEADMALAGGNPYQVDVSGSTAGLVNPNAKPNPTGVKGTESGQQLAGMALNSVAPGLGTAYQVVGGAVEAWKESGKNRLGTYGEIDKNYNFKPSAETAVSMAASDIFNPVQGITSRAKGFAAGVNDGDFGRAIGSLVGGSGVNNLYETRDAIEKQKKLDEEIRLQEIKSRYNKDLSAINGVNLKGNQAGYYAADGGLVPIAGDTFKAVGPSHEQGGISLPNAEIEGGELVRPQGDGTMQIDSERLGTAKANEGLTKEKAKLEKTLAPLVAKMNDKRVDVKTAKNDYTRNTDNRELQKLQMAAKPIQDAIGQLEQQIQQNFQAQQQVNGNYGAPSGQQPMGMEAPQGLANPNMEAPQAPAPEGEEVPQFDGGGYSYLNGDNPMLINKSWYASDFGYDQPRGTTQMSNYVPPLPARENYSTIDSYDQPRNLPQFVGKTPVALTPPPAVMERQLDEYNNLVPTEYKSGWGYNPTNQIPLKDQGLTPIDKREYATLAQNINPETRNINTGTPVTPIAETPTQSFGDKAKEAGNKLLTGDNFKKLTRGAEELVPYIDYYANTKLNDNLRKKVIPIPTMLEPLNYSTDYNISGELANIRQDVNKFNLNANKNIGSGALASSYGLAALEKKLGATGETLNKEQQYELSANERRATQNATIDAQNKQGLDKWRNDMYEKSVATDFVNPSASIARLEGNIKDKIGERNLIDQQNLDFAYKMATVPDQVGTRVLGQGLSKDGVEADHAIAMIKTPEMMKGAIQNATVDAFDKPHTKKMLKSFNLSGTYYTTDGYVVSMKNGEEVRREKRTEMKYRDDGSYDHINEDGSVTVKYHYADQDPANKKTK